MSSQKFDTDIPRIASSATPSCTNKGRGPRPSMYSVNLLTRDIESLIVGKLGVVSWKEIRAIEKEL